MKILLVDDNAFMRDMISNIIDVEDVEIVEAVDGAEAIELFEQSKEGDIRLILMDIIMDNVKGRGVKAVEETAANHSMTVDAATWDSYIDAVKTDLEALEKEGVEA